MLCKDCLPRSTGATIVLNLRKALWSPPGEEIGTLKRRERLREAIEGMVKIKDDGSRIVIFSVNKTDVCKFYYKVSVLVPSTKCIDTLMYRRPSRAYQTRCSMQLSPWWRAGCTSRAPKCLPPRPGLGLSYRTTTSMRCLSWICSSKVCLYT
jgi:hypothetical protein